METVSRRKSDLYCVKETRYRGGHCCIIIKLNKTYLKLQFDYNSVGTNSLRIMGNEHVTLHVIDLQT